MIGKDDRLISSKEGVKILVRETVRMLLFRLKGHQVNNIDNPHLQVRGVFTKDLHGGQGLEGRGVSCADHDYIRFCTFIIAGPFPYPDAGSAVFYGFIHVQILE